MRFKTMTHGGEVTLTIEPGAKLSHTTGGPTEEGYDVSHLQWRLSDDGQRLTLAITRRASDCDGRQEWWRDLEATVGELNEHGFPNWREPTIDAIDYHQRDYSAEAAGY